MGAIWTTAGIAGIESTDEERRLRFERARQAGKLDALAVARFEGEL